MRKSNKVISLILAVVLVAASFTAITAVSASAASDKFTVTATSNFFPERVETFDSTADRITVSYYINSTQMMVNSQWNLYFDPAVLKYCEEDGVNQTAEYYYDEDTGETELLGYTYNICPVAQDSAVINTMKVANGEIHGNNSNAMPIYKLTTDSNTKIGFITVTFDVIDPTKDTTVDLELVELLTNSGQQYKFSGSTEEFDETAFETQSSVYEGNYDPDYENQEPTTEEPTTEEVTTEEPTTEEPTTEEVTTEEPTTEEPVVPDTYTVAGSSAAMFGTTWDATNVANDMTLDETDGLYKITYPDVQPEDAIQLKVLKNHSWDESWGDKETGDNYTFNVVEACDVTVTFDVETETVNVIGDGVTQDTDLVVEHVIAVGNGEDTYLNGANWDPSDTSNELTKVADGLYEITYEDIYAFDNYNIKFVINSVDADGNPTSNPWANNFGSEVEQLYPTGEAIDAVWNGKNCIFEVEEDESTVKFQLDLRDFDFKTKQGAKFTITVTAPEPVEPTTEVPTEAPTDPDKPVLIGDVNGDGNIDVLDALMIKKASVEKITLTADQEYVADVNNDGVVDVLDALMIEKFAVEKITEFPKKA